MKTAKLLLLLLIITHNTNAQCYTNVIYDYGNIIARRIDGTLWARGRNSYGNGGNGTTGFLSQFVQVGTDNNWSNAISSISFDGVYAIKTDGTLWVWGTCNDARVFGLGNMGNLGIITPTQIGTDTNWKSVSDGFAIKTDGTLWSWGRNYDGRLGNGNADDDYYASTPTQVGVATDWKSIETGVITVAIKTNGTLWSWGSEINRLGYPNANVNNSYATPHQVGTDNDWASVSVSDGGGFTACIKTSGTLWAWGATAPFQAAYFFGNGLESFTADLPIQIGTDTNWKQISAAVRTINALKINGTRWGWGENNYYQLGMGQGINATVTMPTQLDTATDWFYITNDITTADGGGNSIGIKQNNSLYYWGYLITSPAFVFTPTLMGTTCSLVTTDFENSSVVVYPNPVNDLVTFQFNTPLEKDCQITIVNTIGQMVYEQKKVFINDANELSLNVSNFQSGVYIVNMKSNTKVLQTKIIKN